MNGIVAVVGSLNLDHLTRVSKHPMPGETVLGRSVATLPGGKGANQAMAALRAGAAVRMIGRVGEDPSGQRYREALREHGLDVDAVLSTPDQRTGMALVSVDDAGENTITVIPGANAALTPTDTTNAATVIQSASVLLLQLEVPLPAIVTAARLAAEAGVRVVLNASPPQQLPEQLCALADPIVVNEHESLCLSGKARSVCVTLGANGARWGTHTSRPPRVHAIDTTGAGDSFAGTLAAHLAAGDSDSVALAAAVRAGAQTATHRGAQGWELPI